LPARFDYVKLQVVRRWLDLLFVRSKQARRSREMDREAARRDASAQAQHRQRQAHYREVTKSDERGRDTSIDPKDSPPNRPRS
jgi:hypothetical protein